MRIIRDGRGMGGFLAPPGHPDHVYVVRGNKNDESCWSVSAAAASPHLNAGISAQAQALLDNAQLTDSEQWERHVYGYFRNSYSPDGTSRNVSDAISTGKLRCSCGYEAWNGKALGSHLSQHLEDPAHHEITVPLPPPEHHLAVLAIREYFPGHQPRLDLIADPGNGYGSYPCARCGQRVQYEARYDKLAVFTSSGRTDPACPQGGDHAGW